ncbi:MAG: YybH family protein [Bdellovibrio sp.]
MEPKQTVETNKSKSRTETGAVEELTEFMKKFTQAFSSRNVDQILSFYSPDVVAFDITPPLQYKGINEYRKSWQQFTDMTASAKLEVEDLHIKANGDLGFSHCLSHMTGETKKGEHLDMWMRHTGVYQKINGQWKIIHEQLSVPIEMQTDKPLWNLDPKKEFSH